MSLGTALGVLALVLQIAHVDGSRPSADEVAQIERVAGGRFWLLLWPRGLGPPGMDLEVYRLPDVSGPMLRRGQMVYLTRPAPSLKAPRVPTEWRVFPDASASWAQVRLSDRTFDDVRGLQDQNRPFTVAGTFRDSEIVTLVEFIRSGPEVRATSGTQTVDRTKPISHVRRTAEGLVEAYLRINDTSDYIVTVRPVGETWTLVSVGQVIA